MSASDSRSIPGRSHAPSTLELDFGTVVRDTADEHGVAPGYWQAPRDMPMWHSFFVWFSAFMALR